MRTRVLTCLLGLALTLPVHAEWISSAQYRGWLEEVHKPNGLLQDRTKALAYTQAVFDLLDGAEICAPQQMQGKVLLLTLRDWMIRYPDRVQAGAAQTIRGALNHIYGCKEESTQ